MSRRARVSRVPQSAAQRYTAWPFPVLPEEAGDARGTMRKGTGSLSVCSAERYGKAFPPVSLWHSHLCDFSLTGVGIHHGTGGFRVFSGIKVSFGERACGENG